MTSTRAGDRRGANTGRDPLGEALELRVAAEERHARGQYFTPDPLVDMVLSLVGSPPPAGSVVLDPACGSGRFLLAAKELWAMDAADLRGFETDPEALRAARVQLPGAQLSELDFLGAPVTRDVAVVVGNPPYIRNRGQKRDIYADFVESSVAQLQEGGRIALVLSNAWLDVDYGKELREQLLDTCALEWLVESSVERWFHGAKINTMVLVARRCSDSTRRRNQQVRFAQVRQALPAEPRVLRTLAQGELRAEPPWGPLLRAPDLYFSVLQGKTPTPLVPLGELAHLQRGFTTNDNRFFYPPPDAGIEADYLQPLLKSPKRLPGVRGLRRDLPDRVFLCRSSREEMLQKGHLGALAWVDEHRRGEEQGSWSLPSQRATRLFVVKGTADRFRQPLLDTPVFADQQLYSVLPSSPDLDEASLAAVLNSSWCKLCMEMAGRVNFGDGVLWLALRDVREQVFVPDLRLLSPEKREKLARSFEALPDGPVPGLVKGSSSHEMGAAWEAGQQHLDAEVGALLGLGSQQQKLLREVLRDRCSSRVRMAASTR